MAFFILEPQRLGKLGGCLIKVRLAASCTFHSQAAAIFEVGGEACLTAITFLSFPSRSLHVCFKVVMVRHAY